MATAREYYARLLQSSVIDTGVTTFERRVVREYVRDFLGLSLDEANTISDDELPRYVLKICNRFLFVNCWHINEDELAGMWD